MFSAASPDSVAENARTRDIASIVASSACPSRSGVDAAERFLHFAQTARGDRVHLACHLIAQQAGHPRNLAEQGMDRAPASGDPQQRLTETGWRRGPRSLSAFSSPASVRQAISTSSSAISCGVGAGRLSRPMAMRSSLAAPSSRSR